VRLHDELAGDPPGNACKLCAYLASLTTAECDEWCAELSLPISVVGNTAVVRALARRGVNVSEGAVRRHRNRHAA
jgi:hypothetical protein